MMLEYWPIFALGALCCGLVAVVWRAVTAPLPPVRHPREDWAEWERIAERARKRRAGQ